MTEIVIPGLNFLVIMLIFFVISATGGAISWSYYCNKEGRCYDRNHKKK